MQRLSPSENLVLLYIFRRTFGFGKDYDAISLTQMAEGITTRDGRVLDHGTGMSRPGCRNGIRGLLDKGIITVRKTIAEDGNNEVNVSRLRFKDGEAPPDWVVNEVNQGGKHCFHGGVVNDVNQGSKRIEPGVVNEVNPQEQRTQKKEQQQLAPPPAPPATLVDAQRSTRPDVVVSSKIKGNESPLISDLIALGVSKHIARQLVIRYPEKSIQDQIVALAFRANIKEPGAVLVQSIKDAWAMPKSYVDAQMKAEQANQNQAERDAADAARETAERAREDRQVKVDAYMAALSEIESQELTEAATRQIRETMGRFLVNRDIPRVLLNATIRTIVADRTGGHSTD